MSDMKEPATTVVNEESNMTGLPLLPARSINLKIFGVIGLLILVVIVNMFFLKTDNQKEEHQGENDTYSLSQVNPMSKPDQKRSTVVDGELATQAKLRQQLEEAKAKDFIERLQVPQKIEGSMSASQSVPNVSDNGGGTNNAAIVKSDDPNTVFLVEESHVKTERSYANHFGSLPYLIGQEKFIFGTLEVAINSDLPGQVRAIVSQHVYAEQGRHILIPAGSRLIGEYRSGLANNQSRLFVVWQRVVTPAGISLMIGSEGTDALGRAGLTGTVDYHFLARFGTATLISLIGAGASTMDVSTSDQYNSSAAYRQAVSQSMAQQATSTLNQSANIPPTVNVPQGSKIVVFVNRDLDFSRVVR